MVAKGASARTSGRNAREAPPAAEPSSDEGPAGEGATTGSPTPPDDPPPDPVAEAASPTPTELVNTMLEAEVEGKLFYFYFLVKCLMITCFAALACYEANTNGQLVRSPVLPRFDGLDLPRPKRIGRMQDALGLQDHREVYLGIRVSGL